MFKEKRINKTHLPVIDISKCSNCDLCYIACTYGTINKRNSMACAKCIKYCFSINVPCNPEHYVFDYKHCNACGLCISVCKNKAIFWYKING